MKGEVHAPEQTSSPNRRSSAATDSTGDSASRATRKGSLTSPVVGPALPGVLAFTIEFDNEFEHQMPHRTTKHGGSRDAPWLVSLVMWSTCMQFVGEEGVTVADLQRNQTQRQCFSTSRSKR